ncbi:DUF3463 domain-containing protein [Streptomyces sp. SL13]|uniref:DUF3463 domain-containing protein n=1 Tax=Streptantibioticus silvisoli TaxID=2705255 RepID=A0AA90GYC6_9ACTN|nr:DUF3463 domain-containing protein [Streptantibioticus silvisoli]MDI5968676.1 DUF3463 domain-containing protein [Streptantibioticus silvisoli]
MAMPLRRTVRAGGCLPGQRVLGRRERLPHPAVDGIVRRPAGREKYVPLCTDAVLLRRELDTVTPSRYSALAVPIDGPRERHDESVAEDGVSDETVAAIKEAKARAFRVATPSLSSTTDTPPAVLDDVDVADLLTDDPAVDEPLNPPAHAHETAPGQEHLRRARQTRDPSKKAVAGGNRKKWRLNHSPLLPDFPEGRADLPRTARAVPNHSLLGWQRPCYLMSDGHVATYRELLEKTDGESHGCGKDPHCASRMAHRGDEPTAVPAPTGSGKETLRAACETVVSNRG